MAMKKKIIIRTNRPIGFIMTDHKGTVLKKGGPTKMLLAKNRAEIKKEKNLLNR